MSFIDINTPALFHPILVYGNLFAYFYGFWLYNIIYTLISVKLFSQVTKLKFPWWLILLNLGYFLIMSMTIGRDVVYLVGLAILLYVFVSHRHQRFTVIFTELLITLIAFYLVMGITGRIANFLIGSLVPAGQLVVVKHLVTPFLNLVEFGLTYWLFTKTASSIRNYAEVVSQQAPILTWVYNLLIFSFVIFKFLGLFGNTPLNSIQYLLVILIYGLIMALIVRYSYRYFNYRILAETQQLELQRLKTYTSYIETMYDDLRRFRHDYKNILLSLGETIQSGNLAATQQIYNQVVIPTNKEIESKGVVLSHLANIQDLEIKSLIYGKVMQALDQGIQVEVEVVDPIKAAGNIKRTDLVRMIAILFDNAINAASKAAKPRINFSFFDHDGSQYIVIGNSTKEEQIPLQQVNGSFKGINMSRHSLGLRNLRIILAGYPFIQHNTSSNQYWFEQELIIHQA